MKILKDIKEYEGLSIEEYGNGLAGLRMAIIEVGKEGSFCGKIREIGKKMGIAIHAYYFNPIITTEELMIELIDLQPHYDAVMIQEPLPKHINLGSLLCVLKADKDICGRRRYSCYEPMRAVGVMDYLKYCGIGLDGKDVVVLGKNDRGLVDRLVDEGATVTICHERSRGKAHIYHCDLVINALGYLDCKGLAVPIIDLCGGCRNWENGDIVKSIDILSTLGIIHNLFLCKGVDSNG